jgi:diguanylate cyclase (GGDEF)-like protein
MRLVDNDRMHQLASLRGLFFTDSQVLRAQRERMLAQLSIPAALLLVPFLIANLVHRQYVLAVVDALIITCLGSAALTSRRRRAAPVRIDLLLLLLFFFGVATVMVTQGFQGALWSYPVLLFCQFALGRRMAFVASALLLVGTSLLADQQSGPEFAWRVFATLLLLWLMVNGMIKVQADAHEYLLKQAGTDPLTGALNRRELEFALAELVKRARRRPVPASMLLMDIDDFKKINDTLGHAAGDQVLTGLVRLLVERKRTADKLYRIGGEEFLLLAPDTVGRDAMILAEQLRVLIHQANLLAGIQVAVSIGVSECRTDQSPDDWLEFADQALYRAKENGRNRVESSDFSDSAFKPTQGA